MPTKQDLLDKAKSAKRESKYVDFKARFDPASDGEWCELTKDLVAMANSGGGVIVIGVNNDGSAAGIDLSQLTALDPAIVSDKVSKYTGEPFSGFELHDLTRGGTEVFAIQIDASDSPIVFSKPGTYAVSEGKQKTAFSRGTVYMRHDAKSEPATSSDLRNLVERRVEAVRRSWLKGIRKVVKAPPGSEIAVYQTTSTDPSGTPTAIRVTDDPAAPVFGKLDPDETHPYRQKDVIPAINAKLPDEASVNSYDIQCVRNVHRLDEKSRPDLCHRPKFGSMQYSDSFVDYVVEEFRKDHEFFAKTRKAHYRLTHS